MELVQDEAAAEAALQEAKKGPNALGPDPDVEEAMALLEKTETEADPEPAPEEDEPGEDKEEAEEAESESDEEPEDEESDDTEDANGEPKRKSRWARKQEELAKAKEAVDWYDQNVTKLLEHTDFAFKQAEELQQENVRPRQRLEEFEISEFDSDAERKSVELERELNEYRRAEAAKAERMKAAQKLQMEKRVQEYGAEMYSSAEKYGVPVSEIYKSFSLAITVDPAIRPATVAFELAQRKGLLAEATAAKRQARANGDAAPTAKLKGSQSGADNPFRSERDNEVDEMVRFLESRK